MSVSVIIPARNEQMWLDRTIANIFDTVTGDIEVIVVLNGYNQEVDKRAKVIRFAENMGERVAMNAAVNVATKTHILRIDAHCDFSPKGWDEMMEEVTGATDMTQAVLTAVDENWVRKPGHWYERTRLLPNMEAKWERPNRKAKQIGSGCAVCDGSGTVSVVPHSQDGFMYVKCVSCGTLYPQLPIVIPNMSSTGCGFMMRRDFYLAIGGANENYPPMGAIGEEFAVKTWLNGGTVQTRTDVVIGHIFGAELTKGDGLNRGYDTNGVLKARQCLVRDFGDRYEEIRAKFPDLDWETSEALRSTDNHTRTQKGITVGREDITTTRNGAGEVIRIKYEWFEYHWLPSEHPDEKDWTEDQIREKYERLAIKVGEKIQQRNLAGDMVDADLVVTPIPPSHYEVK